jgi:peroxiredoxin
MSLQSKLDDIRSGFEKAAPQEAQDALHKAIEELIHSGAEDRVLKVGDLAPEFSLPDPDGNIISSQELLKKGPIVLTFYRGTWCPYCNVDLTALEEVRSEIETRNATLVAISQQTAANSRKSQKTNNLGFPILGDKGGDIGAKFGVRWSVPDYLKPVHKQLGADISIFNGEDSWTLPMPARFVIGQDGIIAYSEVNADYTYRPEPSLVFPVLEALQKIK